MTKEEWDDESHNFTIRESYEVARIVDMLLETDQCLRIKAAAKQTLEYGHTAPGNLLHALGAYGFSPNNTNFYRSTLDLC